MTLTEQIEAALKLPVDQKLRGWADGVCDETKGALEPSNVIYTLLLRIRDLEASQKAAATECEALKAERNRLNFKLANAQAQVEQERWIAVAEELPLQNKEVLAIDSGIVWIAMLSSKGNFFSLDREGDMDCKINPTHWKPINLPA